MRTLVFIVLVHVVFQIIFLSSSQCARLSPNDDNLIEQTCKQTPNYNLCISSLKSDPKSATADVAGLALIMVNVLNTTTTQTLIHINSLLQSQRNEVKEALLSCVENYKIGVLTADVPVSIEALTKGNPKFADQGTQDAANESNSCEEGFSGNSPLTVENTNINNVAKVANAIVKLLL
ncbi:hypothetical protein ACB098_02G064400 [Castanea mollissima]